MGAKWRGGISDLFAATSGQSCPCICAPKPFTQPFCASVHACIQPMGGVPNETHLVDQMYKKGIQGDPLLMAVEICAASILAALAPFSALKRSQTLLRSTKRES